MDSNMKQAHTILEDMHERLLKEIDYINNTGHVSGEYSANDLLTIANGVSGILRLAKTSKNVDEFTHYNIEYLCNSDFNMCIYILHAMGIK